MAVHRAMRSCRLADDLYLKAKYIATTENRSFNNWLEMNTVQFPFSLMTYTNNRSFCFSG